MTNNPRIVKEIYDLISDMRINDLRSLKIIIKSIENVNVNGRVRKDHNDVHDVLMSQVNFERKASWRRFEMMKMLKEFKADVGQLSVWQKYFENLGKMLIILISGRRFNAA